MFFSFGSFKIRNHYNSIYTLLLATSFIHKFVNLTLFGKKESLSGFYSRLNFQLVGFFFSFFKDKINYFFSQKTISGKNNL